MTLDMHHIISPVADYIMYEQCIYNNKHLSRNDLYKRPLNNKKRDAYIGVLYNEFIDTLDQYEEGWLIFCHEDFEFLEDPIPLLEKADKTALYGVFGARLVQNMHGVFFREYIGEINDCMKDGRNPRVLGTSFPDGIAVDTFDCQCLMVHSTLLKKHNLRFDPQLSFNLYVEDFCLTSFIEHGIQSFVLNVRCQHHSQAETIDDRPTFAIDLNYCEAKYEGKGRFVGICNIFNSDDGPPVRAGILLEKKATPNGADIYQHPVDKNNFNLPVVLSAAMMQQNSMILDVGCASGDNGVFLKESLNASLWGLEYNPTSLERAQKTGAYQEVLHFDLDNFNLADYGSFYESFDHVFLGDVLEHITDPLNALKKIAQFIAPNGSCLVSLPNIAHAYIITNLLQEEFTYRNWGILDATHLRFFTKKSMAILFADAGFMITQATATFLIPDEFQPLHTPKLLFKSISKALMPLQNFVVCQYVSKMERSKESPQILAAHNLQQLNMAATNNPKGWEEKQPILAKFKQAVRLSCKKEYPRTLHGIVQKLWDQGHKFEAIEASGLFSGRWYVRTYPEAALSGQPPLIHYLSTGWILGYNPSEHFDTGWYLRKYPEVSNAGFCPLIHYISEGMNAGYMYNQYMAELPEEDT